MNRAQAKFIRDQFLNRFSGSYQRIDPNTFPVLEQLLFQAGLEFNDTIRKNLEKSGSINTGGLADVSVPIIEQDGTSTTLQVGYPLDSKQIKYFDYINQGVKGYGGKKAKPKKASGKYSFRSLKVNYFMANSIAKWLSNARKSVSADRVDLSKVQKKRRSLKKMTDAATNKKRLSFMIATAIKRDGIRATYYFDRAVKKVFNKEFQEAIETAIGADIIIQIRQDYGNNNNR